MITQIFEQLSDIVAAFVKVVTDLFSSAVSIFYTAGQGEQPGSLTVVGTLSLIALGTGLVIWAFYFIKRLITSATTRAR